MNKVGWLKFAALLLPDARDLLRDLWRWHKGDVTRARTTLLKIRNHGFRLDEAEDAIDERMEAISDAELIDPKTKA